MVEGGHDALLATLQYLQYKLGGRRGHLTVNGGQRGREGEMEVNRGEREGGIPLFLVLKRGQMEVIKKGRRDSWCLHCSGVGS